ncbi:MAG: alpha-ketoglutarate-dependent dioxygenase AlkB [Aureispira sp.]|nr:alpha-ketoglutarate-dependent dioxygenase AlkB [Aureispira sp.]
MKKHILINTDGQVVYYPHFFSEQESQHYFENLNNILAWKKEQITFFGKTYWQPRLIAWYGEKDLAYNYSGNKMQALNWTNTLLEIKAKVELLCNVSFNSVLANLYRDGQDSMGWHSDDEKELGKNPIIASLSLGGTRRFHFRHKHDKALKNQSIDLKTGSLVLMKGALQHHWQHQVSKTKRTVPPRINLTFRTIKDHLY